MKYLLHPITDHSTMIDGFSYDRTIFEARGNWNRSLISAAISTALSGLGVYAGYMMAEPTFAAALGAQALQAKLATGTVIAALVGYSLRDLFRSITRDVTTQLRVAVANSWLAKGTVHTEDLPRRISMQQVQLSMVRFVEQSGGIKIFAIGQPAQFQSPVLIETLLADDEYPAHAVFYSHPDDIRSRLNDACAEWTFEVADMLGIKLNTVEEPQVVEQQPQQVLQAVQEVQAQQPLQVVQVEDDDLDDLELERGLGRASASSMAKLNIEREPKKNIGEVLRKAATVPSDAVIQ